MQKKIVFALCLLLSACVSTKKYNSLQEAYKKSQETLEQANNDMQKLRLSNETLKKEVYNLATENEILKEKQNLANQAMASQIENAKDKYEKLDNQYKSLFKSQRYMEISLIQKDSIQRQIAKEKAQLDQSLQQKQQEIQTYAQRMAQREKTLKQATDYALKLEMQLAQKEKEVKELEQELRELETLLAESLKKYNKLTDSLERQARKQDSLTNQIALDLTESLREYKKDEVAIHAQDGYVFLVMPDKLLFDKSKTKLEIDGIDVIKSIAEVVRKQERVAIQVANSEDQKETQTQATQMLIKRMREEGIMDIQPKKPYVQTSPPKIVDTKDNASHTTIIFQAQ